MVRLFSSLIIDFIPSSFLFTHVDIVILTTKKDFLHRDLKFLLMSHKAVLLLHQINQWTS